MKSISLNIFIFVALSLAVAFTASCKRKGSGGSSAIETVIVNTSAEEGSFVLSNLEVEPCDNCPPWKLNELMSIDQVPAVYITEWKKAENVDTCAPLVLFGAELEDGITIRSATFWGGWAVAYDTPSQRSAFGIAGTGAIADGTEYKFPNRIDWSDGSYVSYGLEGGTGPNYLAYLTVSGQGCLYNVWTTRGKEHLELLIDSIRMIESD